jgi:uncharacterized protein YjiS (DUF1127 family)
MLAHLDSIPARSPTPARQTGRALGAVTRAVQAMDRWLEQRRQHQALGSLDDDQLRDIGLSRDDVERACARPFWQRP